jgi:hypothetical protein
LTTTESINDKLVNNLPTVDVINQIGRELNCLNRLVIVFVFFILFLIIIIFLIFREYADLLREYNYKIKLLTNTIVKTDKKLSVSLFLIRGDLVFFRSKGS